MTTGPYAHVSNAKGSDEHDNHLDPEHRDPLMAGLNRLIRHGIRVLAALMVLVIFWCIADVVLVMYEKLSSPPVLLLSLNDILAGFRSFAPGLFLAAS